MNYQFEWEERHRDSTGGEWYGVMKSQVFSSVEAGNEFMAELNENGTLQEFYGFDSF